MSAARERRVALMSEAAAIPQPVPLFRRPAVLKLLVIALLAEVGYATLNLSTMPVYLADDRRFGASVIGLVLAAFLLAEAVFKSPMGHLADKYGPKPLMLIGPSVSVVTTLLSLIIPHRGGAPLEVLAFIVLRAFDGLALAMLWPAAFAEMNAVVADEERQQGMSILNLCYMLGIAFAFPLGGFANDAVGSKAAGLVLADVLFLAVALCVWFFIPKGQAAPEAKAASHEGSLADFVNSMKQIPEYLLLATITFAGIGFPTFIFKLFPTDEFGYSESQIGAFILPGALIMAGASVPMSRLGEKMGRVRAVHLGLGLCAVGMSIVGVGAFVPMLRLPWMLALGGLPTAIGFLLAVPAWMASVSDLDPAKRGSNLGAVMTAQGLGAIVGAPIGAAMYEKLQPLGHQLRLDNPGHYGNFGHYSPFAGCAACLILGWLISLKILRDKPEASPQEPAPQGPVPLITDTVGIVAAEKAATQAETPKAGEPIQPSMDL